MDAVDENLVHRRFERQAALRPDAAALRDDDRTVTYRDLNEWADGIAQRLRRTGLHREGRVALLFDRSAELLAAYLSVFKSGATAVLLDPAHPPARIQRSLQQTAPAVLLTVGTLADRALPGLRVIRLDDDHEHIAGGSHPQPVVTVHPDAIAYIVQTSGSTGVPKRVAVTHRSIAHSTWTHQDGHRIVPQDQAAWLSPPGSSASVGELWPYLTAGATVHPVPNDVAQSAPDLRDWLVSRRITKVYVSMPMAELLYTLPWPSDCPLELMTVGSDQVRRWASADLPFEVAVAYGSAEANGVSSCLVPPSQRLTSATAGERDRAALPPVGRAWPDVAAYIVRDGFLVADGTLGELWVGGPELARGYVDDPAQTAERFRPDPFGEPGSRVYLTGDLAVRRTSGLLEHHGRADREIKIRGFRVHPAEVEAELLRIPGVRDVVVVGVDHDRRGRVLAAYLVADRGLDTAAVGAELAERLPQALVPAAFTLLDRLPTTPNGKVDRDQLPPPVFTAGLREYRAPRDPVEQCLVDAFAETLDIVRVGIDDNFFHLGGDSLTGSQLVQRVRPRFDQRVLLRTLFRHPTPAALADQLREAGARLLQAEPLDAQPM